MFDLFTRPTPRSLPLGACYYQETVDHAVKLKYLRKNSLRDVGSLVGHTDRILIVHVLQQAIFTASKDGTAKLWDKDDLHCIVTMPFYGEREPRLCETVTYISIHNETKMSVYNSCEKRLICTFDSSHCSSFTFDRDFLLYHHCVDRRIIVRDLTKNGQIVGKAHVSHIESPIRPVFLEKTNQVGVIALQDSLPVLIVLPLAEYFYTYDFHDARLRKYVTYDSPEVNLAETDRTVFDLLTTHLPPELAIMAL